MQGNRQGGRSAALLCLETRKQPAALPTKTPLLFLFRSLVRLPTLFLALWTLFGRRWSPLLIAGLGRVALLHLRAGRQTLFDRWRLFYGWWLLLLRAPWLRLLLPDLVRTGRGLLYAFRLGIVPARLLLIALLLLLLILLPNRLGAGLVAVMLLMQPLLLLCLLRITLTRVLALVAGQRRPWRNGLTVPAVPSLALLFPLRPPV